MNQGAVKSLAAKAQIKDAIQGANLDSPSPWYYAISIGVAVLPGGT